MITVGICDDETAVRGELRGYLERYAASAGAQLEIREYRSGEELLASEEAMPDILLLDIQMAGISGMEAARRLREKNGEMCIIFVTNLIQYAIEGYEVQAFRFLKKPISYEAFEAVAGQAVRTVARRRGAAVTVKNDRGFFHLQVESVLWCETYRGHCLIHNAGGQVECYTSLGALEKLLVPHDFFRCHTAYLVSLAQVAELGTAELKLRDGTVIPVSKHRRRELTLALTRYWGGNLL